MRHGVDSAAHRVYFILVVLDRVENPGQVHGPMCYNAQVTSGSGASERLGQEGGGWEGGFE